MRLIIKRGKNKQKTIQKKANFSGVSLITGKIGQMKFIPAQEDTGIRFYLKGEYIPALAENIAPSNTHTTVITNGKRKLLMIEHLMAAVWGMGIDNLVIALGSSFVPAKGASAKAYVELIKKVGIVNQGKKRKVIEIKEEATFKQPPFKNRFAEFKPGEKELTIKSTAPWPKPVGEHTIKYKSNPSNFEKEISWARTFLRSPLDLNDLSKWESIRKKYKVLPKDPKKSPIITFDDQGFITPLRRKDEPARHKVLDLIGDLALVGYRIYGKCIVNEPGHSFSHEIANQLRKKATKLCS